MSGMDKNRDGLDTAAYCNNDNFSAGEEKFRWEAVVNGKSVNLKVAPTKRLLHLLREDLGLTGTKRSCEIGRCGSCIVLIDDRPMNGCLVMAYQCAGRRITTIEGLHGSTPDSLHPIQQAFLEEGGFQCGYCTPGMILSVKALLDGNPHPTRKETEEALSGNLCRCTGYGGIFRAVERASELTGKEEKA